MLSPLSIRVFDRQELRFAVECTGPIEIGRDKGGETPGRPSATAGGTRLAIAAQDERTVGREQARIEPLADGHIRLTNLSSAVVIALPDGSELAPNASRELPLPAVFRVGSKAVRVQATEHSDLGSLAHATVPPSRSAASVTRFPALAGAHDPADLVRWLQQAQAVLHSAAGSDDFFDRAAQAAVDIVGLDSARILLLEDGDWRPHPAGGPPPSRTVLARVRAERRTFWSRPRDVFDAASLAPVQAVIAAPILNSAGDVIGALYGERRGTAHRPPADPVTKLEALLVELLAGAVAAGLARLEEEKHAAAARVRYEEFLTPELARHLMDRPKLLEGRAVEVTVLFADIRGYSAVSEKLGPEETVKWVGDVLGELSDCVREQGGVLVDYIGDELMAMWGDPAAMFDDPTPRPDHAARACRAANAMLARLPAVDERWRSVTGRQLRLGFGIHTGPAHVGNVGTRHKFKYGPLGPTNNLASRVQGATKFVGVPLLVTGATRAKIDGEFATRRLTKVKVVNIAEPVDLVELAADPPAGWDELRDGYEAALADFEAKRLHDATRKLGSLLSAYPNDGPSLLLLTRAVQCLQPNCPPFDPVWVLPGK
jgi:adenylate cyclase